MARFLYADDNEEMRRAFTRWAPRLGHELVAVDDAARACELIGQGEKFDIIVSDYEMPEMDGLSFLRLVRSTFHTKSTPFFLISGRTKTEEGHSLADICKNHGAHFVPKADVIISEFLDTAVKRVEQDDQDETLLDLHRSMRR